MTCLFGDWPVLHADLTHPADTAIARASWEKVLFADRPSRFELMKLQTQWPLIDTVIRVHRNHSFEHVAAAAEAWFAWWGRRAQYVYSDYDDSLSFAFSEEQPVHLEVLWLDVERYASQFSAARFAEWLAGRLIALRSRTEVPILLVTTGADNECVALIAKAARALPGVRVADLGSVNNALGARFFDDRAARFSGTRLSDAACLLSAREFACRWTPALLRVRLKAIAVDLDNTLFEGVLGEDGNQVRLTETHRDLQTCLLALRDQGVFLALVSRNEAEDVKQLFDSRRDFPLRWEHFSATAVNWNSKSENIRQVARSLRIGADAVLFVDDNPGELAAVASESPEVSLLHADPNPAVTRRALDYYPGLWAWERSATDAIRAADLQAETERARLATECADPRDYLRSLQVKLCIDLTPRKELARLHELSQKTNQFNLNLQRLSEVDLACLLESPDHRVAAIGLSDRLSDSGLIGLLVAHRQGGTLSVRELAISCRALGRRLEDLMVSEAVRAIVKELPSSRIEFLHRTGPRNAPARDWLARFSGESLQPEGRVPAHHALAHFSPSDYPVEILVTQNESSRS